MGLKMIRMNIKSNFYIYKMYIIATTIILSIFVTFLNFTSDKIILEKISENSRVEVMAQSIYIFLLLLSFLFLIYFNYFFLRNRSKDIGTLAILGFSKNKIIKILSYENLIVLGISFIISIFLGKAIYILISNVIIKILHLNLINKFKIEGNVILKILIISIFIFIINTIINAVLIKKNSLISFVKFSKKHEKKYKDRKYMAVFGFICLLVCYILSLLSFQGVKGIWGIVGINTMFSFIILIMGVGNILVVKYGLSYILNLKKKNKTQLYTPVGNIIYPRMTFRILTRNKLLITLSSLLILTIMMIGIMIITLVYPIKAIERITPSAIEYYEENGHLTTEEINYLSEKYHTKLLKVTILRIDASPQIPITENEAKKIDYFDIIKKSDYIKLMKNQDNDRYIEHIDKYQTLLINYYPTEKPLNKTFKLSSGENIVVNKVSTKNIFSFANSVTTLVVNDKLYEKIESNNENRKRVITTLNGSSIRDNKEIYEHFKNIEDLQSSYWKKYTIIKDNSSTFIFISFIAILLVVCTASILYFTNLVEILQSKKEYCDLKKIGYSSKQLRVILSKEIGVLYKVPIILGILNGSFMIFAFRFIFIDNLI